MFQDFEGYPWIFDLVGAPPLEPLSEFSDVGIQRLLTSGQLIVVIHLWNVDWTAYDLPFKRVVKPCNPMLFCLSFTLSAWIFASWRCHLYSLYSSYNNINKFIIMYNMFMVSTSLVSSLCNIFTLGRASSVSSEEQHVAPMDLCGNKTHSPCLASVTAIIEET